MTERIKKNIEEIVAEYYKHFLDKKNNNFVVKESIPVVWFGNIEEYFKSEKKIITVSLNPSKVEFEEERFGNALNNPSVDELYKAYNNYFNDNPYQKWFRNYEKILNIFKASYGGKMNAHNTSFDNYSIHIDIGSPIATDPTWGRLDRNIKRLIACPDLFNSFLSTLKPDIILISISKKEFLAKFNLTDNDFINNYLYEGKRGIYISAYKKENTDIILGRNFGGTPFGGMSDGWKKDNIPKLLEK